MIVDQRWKNDHAMPATLYCVGADIDGKMQMFPLLGGPLVMERGATYIVRVNTEAQYAQVIGVEFEQSTPALCGP